MEPLLETALRGFAIGFVIMMPIGPMAVLCIARTLANGRLAGVATGLGVCAADLVYSTIAALGISGTTRFAAVRLPLAVAGGVLLAVVGILRLRRSATSGDALVAAVAPARAHGRAFVSAFVLTLGVPASTLAYAAAYAAFARIGAPVDRTTLATLTAATFVGSLAWFVVLSALAHAARARISGEVLARLDRAVAAVLTAAGIGGAIYAILRP